MWQCAKAGGFEMIASAANGREVTGSGLYMDWKKPCNIVEVIFRFELTSPLVRDAQPGKSPGSRMSHRLVKLLFGRTLHHVRHESLRVSADVEEFQSALEILPVLPFCTLQALRHV